MKKAIKRQNNLLGNISNSLVQMNNNIQYLIQQNIDKDKRLSQVEKRLSKIEKKLKSHDDQFKKIKNRLDRIDFWN